MTKLLVIDDEEAILETIGYAFPDYEVTTCTNGKTGIEAFRTESPDVVVCDIRLPDMSGMDILDKPHDADNKVPIILMTGHGTAGTAIEAMQRGAFEYVLKPLDPDTLIPLVESAAETSRMMRVPAVVPEADTAPESAADPSADILIGNCPAMQEVYRSIGRVARQDVTVLILGESGTGKEVVARAIYNYSARNKGRFLAINCAAIPEALLESELFGHEKGAFTGADRKRIGKFEQCNRGTLFLDEIGDMTPLMQTKILRVLQDQTFERVGGTETIETSARIIAATNRDLEKAIQDKDFREDLFYRLNVYTINLPPLRERGKDITLLCQHFAKLFSRELDKEFSGISPAALEILQKYHWPGNVRQLQSVIKHALLQATGPVIAPAFLPKLEAEKEIRTSATDSPATTEDKSASGAIEPRPPPQVLLHQSLQRTTLLPNPPTIHHQNLLQPPPDKPRFTTSANSHATSSNPAPTKSTAS